MVFRNRHVSYAGLEAFTHSSKDGRLLCEQISQEEAARGQRAFKTDITLHPRLQAVQELDQSQPSSHPLTPHVCIIFQSSTLPQMRELGEGMQMMAQMQMLMETQPVGNLEC